MVAGHRRTRPVERQRQLLRHPGQRAPPVRQLLCEHTVRIGVLAQQFTLPQGVVGVLHRQRLPARHLATATRRIRRGDVPRQWSPSTSRPPRCDASPATAHARPAAPRTARPAAVSPATDRRRTPPPRATAPARSSGSATSITGSSTTACSAPTSRMCWTGRPSTVAYTVRSTSCRATTSPSAARSAPRSNAPVSRSAAGMLYVALGPSN